MVGIVENPGQRIREHRQRFVKGDAMFLDIGLRLYSVPLSPLLSNLYMRRFVLGWKVLGHARRLKAHLVNYADDFVICCDGTAEEAIHVMRTMMTQLKLTVNEHKTRCCQVPEESFDFPGTRLVDCTRRERATPTSVFGHRRNESRGSAEPSAR